MKCFNCGKETDTYLCLDCRTEEVLDKLIPQMLSYKADQRAFPRLVEYVATLPEEREVRKCIPQILALLPAELEEYYCPGIIMEYNDICRQGPEAILAAAQNLGMI